MFKRPAWQSNLSPSEQAQDDWLSNFNDLSTDFSGTKESSSTGGATVQEQKGVARRVVRRVKAARRESGDAPKVAQTRRQRMGKANSHMPPVRHTELESTQAASKPSEPSRSTLVRLDSQYAPASMCRTADLLRIEAEYSEGRKRAQLFAEAERVERRARAAAEEIVMNMRLKYRYSTKSESARVEPGSVTRKRLNFESRARIKGPLSLRQDARRDRRLAQSCGTPTRKTNLLKWAQLKDSYASMLEKEYASMLETENATNIQEHNSRQHEPENAARVPTPSSLDQTTFTPKMVILAPAYWRRRAEYNRRLAYRYGERLELSRLLGYAAQKDDVARRLTEAHCSQTGTESEPPSADPKSLQTPRNSSGGHVASEEAAGTWIESRIAIAVERSRIEEPPSPKAEQSEVEKIAGPASVSRLGNDSDDHHFNAVVEELKRYRLISRSRLSEQQQEMPRGEMPEVKRKVVELSSHIGVGMDSARSQMPVFISTSTPSPHASRPAFESPAEVNSKLEAEPERPERVGMPDFASIAKEKSHDLPISNRTSSQDPSMLQTVKDSWSRLKWGGIASGGEKVISNAEPEQNDEAYDTLASLYRSHTPAVEAAHPASIENGSVRETPHVESKGLKLTETSEHGGLQSSNSKKPVDEEKVLGSRSSDHSSIRYASSDLPLDEAELIEEPHSPRSGEDTEHKPLWEVMRSAESMSTSANDETNPTETEADKETNMKPEATPLDLPASNSPNIDSIEPSKLQVNPLNIPQPPVPGLEYGLDRVLFNSGVYHLQDPYSRVYNFDPYLQKIMPVNEFDFNALKEYKTSSQDLMLSALAKEHNKRYIGSTSSMTATLCHFHYLLSNWRPINLNMLSRGFNDKTETFTAINRAPNAIFLRWKNGTYAIDADKEFDGANVLMMLGKSMEKLLTMSTSEYERYRKSDPRTVSDEERNAPESFEYTTLGDFLMRSQLDAYDHRLPGNGMFDLKTRAVLSVRMDAEDFKPMTGYEIHTLQGRWESYEREYFDMIRATMLKYMLQARMGRMEGIFVAYHNVERIFGFQYIPIREMDRAIHGQVDRCLGDQEFKASLSILNEVLNKATAKFPEQSLRFHFETTTEGRKSTSPATVMWVYAEPMAEADIDRIQSSSKAKVTDFERTVMGIEKNDEASAKDHSSSSAEQTDNAVNMAATSKAHRASSTHFQSQFTTSNSAADPSFIQSIEPTSSSDRRPLFVASIICKSRVNDTYTPRPEALKATDDWKIEYLLKEWDANDEVWAQYEQMKDKRKQIFQRPDDEGASDAENGELTPKEKRERGYIEFLREMSKRGREFRRKMDEYDAGKTPIVVGQSLSGLQRNGEEKIEDVDEYLRWLYEEKES